MTKKVTQRVLMQDLFLLNRDINAQLYCILTIFDRCSCLLAGGPMCVLDRLKSVLNSAAELVCNRRKFDRVTPFLPDLLHWLPVQYRIDYKLALLVYKSLHGAAPVYLESYCVGVSTSRAGARLRYEL